MIEVEKLIMSFVIGGIICVFAQLLIDLTRLTPARILVFYVCFGVLLGGIGLYEPVFDFSGAGISVPIIGFGGAIARGVKESVDKSGALGILTGPFTASAAGCSAALVFGYVTALLSKGKPKRT